MMSYCLPVCVGFLYESRPILANFGGKSVPSEPVMLESSVKVLRDIICKLKKYLRFFRGAL